MLKYLMHDSHIHMALSPLKENYESDIQDFVDLNGKKILTQGTEIADYNDTLDIVERINSIFPNVADLALGIHPTIFGEAILRNNLDGLDIFKYAKKQMSFFEEIFNKNKERITAIGETGLDYFDMYHYDELTEELREDLKEIQRRSFNLHCKLARENKLPLSIHSRDIADKDDCTKEVLHTLAHEGKGQLRGCFHSYTGSIELAREIVNMDFYIGFNAIITYPSGNNVREVLKEIPLDRILIETDGPFLPTQSIRKNKKEHKRYGRPVLVKEIIETASKIKGVSYDTFEEKTDQNYFNLFTSSLQ
jgi:TatD DNase family protein